MVWVKPVTRMCWADGQGQLTKAKPGSISRTKTAPWELQETGKPFQWSEMKELG